MTRTEMMRHQYVETIPDRVQDGVLYISEEYSTAVHKCCCGCGQEVVTPLGPTDWNVTIENEKICVRPSIGNWSFPCQSHYWIDRGHIRWAKQWSQEQINNGRIRDRLAKQRHYGQLGGPTGFWGRLWSWILNIFGKQ